MRFFYDIFRTAHGGQALVLALALLLLATMGALVMAWRRRRALRHAASARTFSVIPELLVAASFVALMAVVAWELWHTHGVVNGSISISSKWGQRSVASMLHYNTSLLLILLFSLCLPLVATGLSSLIAARHERSGGLAALRALEWSTLVAAPVFFGGLYYFAPYQPASTSYYSYVTPWQILNFRLYEVQSAGQVLMLCLAFSLLGLVLATLVKIQRVWRNADRVNETKRWAPLASAFFFAAALLLIAITPYRQENLDPLATSGPLTSYIPSTTRPPDAMVSEKVQPAPVLLADREGGVHLKGNRLEIRKPWEAHRALDRLEMTRAGGPLIFVADRQLSAAKVRQLLSASYAAHHRKLQLVFCSKTDEQRPVLGKISRRGCSALTVQLGLTNEEPATTESPNTIHKTRPVALPKGYWGDAAAALARLAEKDPTKKIRLIID